MALEGGGQDPPHLMCRLCHNSWGPASLDKVHPGPQGVAVFKRSEREEVSFLYLSPTWLASGLTEITELIVLHVSLAKTLVSGTQRA